MLCSGVSGTEVRAARMPPRQWVRRAVRGGRRRAPQPVASGAGGGRRPVCQMVTQLSFASCRRPSEGFCHCAGAAARRGRTVPSGRCACRPALRGAGAGRSSDSRARSSRSTYCPSLPRPCGPVLHDGGRSRSPLRGSPGFPPGSLLPPRRRCRTPWSQSRRRLYDTHGPSRVRFRWCRAGRPARRSVRRWAARAGCRGRSPARGRPGHGSRRVGCGGSRSGRRPGRG